ncbi:DUF3040 domain-containing protein [Arthrobacter sp. NyZ413]|uniref:DUF3040 domain-containing protein n=1 Tax=Arthrobacter sp. NyZ413 TaxID=3144669 RepID=UPI003BF7D7D9
MALSEREEKALMQMAENLEREDPALASFLRGYDDGRPPRHPPDPFGWNSADPG